MTDWFIGLEGKGEKKLWVIHRLPAWEKGPADPDLIYRHLLNMVAGTGE